MEWSSLQTDCPDSARKIWPWSSYRHHPHDGSWRSASCLQHISLEKRQHYHGAWRANFHYVLRELRTNLLALITGNWCCRELLLQVREKRVIIKCRRVPSTELRAPGCCCSVSAAKLVGKSRASWVHTVLVQTLWNSSPSSTCRSQFLPKRLFWFLSMPLPP